MTLNGTIHVPGDKSVSHRTLIFSGLCAGESVIENILDGEDVRSTARCLTQLGVEIDWPKNSTRAVVRSTGVLSHPQNMLNCGNSGTTIRLMAGLLSAQNFPSTLTGDDSLRKRPMSRVTAPLQQMGANIRCRKKDDFAPLDIEPARHPLRGLIYETPVASAQIKSALLLAGLFADGETVIRESALSRDHTEHMLRHLGVPIQSVEGSGYWEARLPADRPRPPFRPVSWEVPGDFSSAAFFIVGALVVPGSSVTLKNIGLNVTRTGLLAALEKIGVRFQIDNRRELSGEPVGDLRVEYTPLSGNLEITEAEIPALIDEIPALAVLGAFLDGTLTIRGAHELRKKESDRLEAIGQEFAKLDIPVKLYPDGLSIQGFGDIGSNAGASQLQAKFPRLTPTEALFAHKDHRIAMALAILNRALSPKEPWEILGRSWVDISFPGFFNSLEALSQSGSAT